MKRDYEITNDKARGDMAGQLGGVKIEQRGDKRIVRMSANQAKWFLEHGQIKSAAAAPAAAAAGAEDTRRSRRSSLAS